VKSQVFVHCLSFYHQQNTVWERKRDKRKETKRKEKKNKEKEKKKKNLFRMVLLRGQP
jgi:hypothetical protein